MKVTWKKTSSSSKRARRQPPLPSFDQDEEEAEAPSTVKTPERDDDDRHRKSPAAASTCFHLAQSFHDQGDQLAQEGKYREALGKWEAALNLAPDRAVLHEQKAQVLLELGDAWNAFKAASRATELEPNWSEAWMTLGRAQLNFGEPDASLESFNRALAIDPDSKEAQTDRETAMQLVKKRKQLHASGLTGTTETRFKVGDKANIS